MKRQVGLMTAVLIIVADMIGSGIFILPGIVLNNVPQTNLVILLWLIGGIVAISGSLCYAELATMWPDAGGEYVYLRNTFGLLPSFLTGWISLFVGFTASIAGTTLVLTGFLESFLKTYGLSIQFMSLSPDMSIKLFGCSLVVLFGVVNIIGVKLGAWFQNFLTVFKLLIVLSLIIFGLYVIQWAFVERISAPIETVTKTPMTFSFSNLSLGLLLVMFSYSGWNGATYIGGEIKNPSKNLPKALLYGALLTTVIYILLNVVFLGSATGDVLIKQMKTNFIIGSVATENLSKGLAPYYSLGIVVILLSAIAVQIMIGPRVYYAMAKDKALFSVFGNISQRFNTPILAIILQILISIVYILLVGKENIDSLYQYMGFSLSIFPLLTVFGLFYLRWKRPELNRPYKVPFYPLLPILYITLTILMMAGSLYRDIDTKGFASFYSIGIVLLGSVIYYIWNYFVKKKA